MSQQTQDCYEFGAYRLEPSERLLLRSGQPIPLAPKAFETLLLLVQNSGHVLSKATLIKAIWPDSFVEENNLTQQISQLRRVLAESSPGETYIQTVPRLGYRFAMPVRELGEGAGDIILQRRTRMQITVHEQEEEIDPEEARAQNSQHIIITPQPKTLGMSWRWAAAAALGTLTLAAAAYWAAVRRGQYSPVFNSPRTVAILPFRNLKPDTETQFLGYSLTDAIIQRLGYVSGIVVRPASYVTRYRDGEADPRHVAKELDVQSVLTGSYLKEGDRLRVSAELIDVAKGEVVWRDSFDLPFDRLLTVQDRVAENVARGLQLRILPQEAAQLRRTLPKNPVAYEYYLRAQTGMPNDYVFPMQMLEKSVSFDPDYAPAWMKLGGVYTAYATWQGGGPSYREKGRAAYVRAGQLDPDMPMLHVWLAVDMMERGNLDEGLRALREELRINSNEAVAHWWLTEAYLYGGMLDESIAEGEQALQLDPQVNAGSTLNSYLHAGRYDKFLATLPPGEGARTVFYRGLCYLYMRDSTRAAAEFERAYLLDPTLLHAKYGRAMLYALKHQSGKGIRFLQKVEQETPAEDGEMLYKMAQAYAVLGDAPSALRLWRSAIDHNFYCAACFERDPLMASIHAQPDYSAIMKTAEARHENFRKEYF